MSQCILFFSKQEFIIIRITVTVLSILTIETTFSGSSYLSAEVLVMN